MRLNTLVAGVLAYFISLLLPILMYDYLALLLVPGLMLDIFVLLTVGAVVGIASALITRSKSRAILASITGGVLGLLTPYITFNVFRITVLQRALPYYLILLPPVTAALFSLAYLTMVKPVPQTVKEEVEKEIIEERKEKLELEEKEAVKEHEVEEKPVEVAAEEVVKVVGSGKVSEVEHEPELDILKELVKEIEEEKEAGEVSTVEEAAPLEERLKKCKSCGGFIPFDSIYCPLCGEHQGE
ncbi:MAG: hypothetical protein QXO45_05515 [Nitrososphaerota archaeon]